MSDESTASRPNEDAQGTEVAAMLQGLGSGERLVALGAGLVVVDYLLFDLILEEYGFFTGTLLAAAAALFAMWVRHGRPGASWPVPYPWTLKVLGYAAGFLGLIELLTDLRLGVLDNAVDIVGGLVLYVGVTMMVLGPRQSEG